MKAKATITIVTIVAMVAAVGAVTMLTSTSLIEQASAQGLICEEKGHPTKGAEVRHCNFDGFECKIIIARGNIKTDCP